MLEEDEVKKLEELTKKVDELTKTISEIKKGENATKISEIAAEKEEKVLETLNEKIDRLTNSIKEMKTCTEDKIKENPLAYLAGAFTGGIIIGLLVGKGKEQKN